MFKSSIQQIVYDSDVRYMLKSIPLSIPVRSTDNCKFSTRTYYDLTVRISLFNITNMAYSIVFPRSNGYFNICSFVNIDIQTFGWHIQKSGVVLKTIWCQLV